MTWRGWHWCRPLSAAQSDNSWCPHSIPSPYHDRDHSRGFNGQGATLAWLQRDLAVTIPRVSSRTCLGGVVHLWRILECRTWTGSFANWFTASLCYSFLHDMVWFDASSTIRTSQGMAYLCLHRESVEIYALQTHRAFCLCHWLHTTGLWLLLVSDTNLFTIVQLPDSFAEELEARGVSQTPSLLAHCRRELFHAVWRLILDPEFLNAYEHGILLPCSDGVLRRVYPRIFTYSADYPEK